MFGYNFWIIISILLLLISIEFEELMDDDEFFNILLLKISNFLKIMTSKE